MATKLDKNGWWRSKDTSYNGQKEQVKKKSVLFDKKTQTMEKNIKKIRNIYNVEYWW